MPLHLRTPEQAAAWLKKHASAGLTCDSRELQAGMAFVAWPGAAHDARRYIAAALQQGATASLMEAQDAEPFLQALDASEWRVSRGANRGTDQGTDQPGSGLAGSSDSVDFDEPAWAIYTGLKADIGLIAAAYYSQDGQVPGQAVQVLAVTGTNGKTSSTWCLAQALNRLHGPACCAVVGTLGVGVPTAANVHANASAEASDAAQAAGLQATGLTTPDPVRWQRELRAMADRGLRYCAVEASSIGIAEHRLAGTPLRLALFTNFTQDHLDHHGNMQAYWQAKQALFDTPDLPAAVVNVDDPQGPHLLAHLGRLAAQQDLRIWTLSCQDDPKNTWQNSWRRGDLDALSDAAHPALLALRQRAHHLQASALDMTPQGMAFVVQEDEGPAFAVQTRFVGAYNVSNLLGVVAALRELGVDLREAVAVCAELEPPPGRMQQVLASTSSATPTSVLAPSVWVDYAHTPDALEKALLTLQAVARSRGGRLHVVFGCGGDRDRQKRPLMGAVAARLAPVVWLTSDNPRTEDPMQILSEIQVGWAQVGARQPIGGVCRVQPDRALAIAHCIAQAGAQDLVLIAGKGHENTQEIAGEKRAFSDAEHAAQALQDWLLAHPDADGDAPLSAATDSTTDQPANSQAEPHTKRHADPHADSVSGAVWMNLHEALACIKASTLWPRHARARIVGDGATAFARVHSDTRSLRAHDLFVALRGEKFDAHQFLSEARQKGAVAALAEEGLEAAGLSGLEVTDSKLALAAMAAGWRARLSVPVIAVTGSNGKTTVTQMIASILRAAWGDAVCATQGNFNNDIGLPLSVLGLRSHHRAAVFELGMNHPGEIAHLARIAQPQVALVNNAQREHLEFMQSIEAVARENGGVIEALPEQGIAVFPADDAQAPIWRQLAGARSCWRFALQDPERPGILGVVGIGIGPLAEFTAHAEWDDDGVGNPGSGGGSAWRVQAQTPLGPLVFRLAMPGWHNIKNALAAAACALAAQAPLVAIVEGLQSFRAVAGRSRLLRVSIGHGHNARAVSVVDDSYNANPDSMRAAIDVLSQLPGPHLLVLGDMGEVGEQGPEFHAEIGEYATERGIENLYCIGDNMRYCAAVFPQARHFPGVDSLIAAVTQALAEHRSVLIKGSRFMKMERVVQAVATLSGDAWGEQETGHVV